MKSLLIVNMIRKLGISILFYGRVFIVFIFVDLFVLIIVMGSMGNELNIGIIDFSMISLMMLKMMYVLFVIMIFIIILIFIVEIVIFFDIDVINIFIIICVILLNI